ncbi:hypothetical protein AMK06_CH02277 [Rhizobium sp. N541]|uniref:MotA/TolQ/ExbB proton channel family protein n=1 Tax=unclassified Rhizobium TaxID=2613769 RepID=UPI0007F0829A|nr:MULTISPECIES: MotA/TolQ/ExbB proton channel family protein [unclassified Rhizobium]ANM17173.1 hypothetical protein AMK06_CH02277 [Rhizobium sp. N541]ANM23558.1 hypothetical protein AMK07_CH02274 [Rhizobium sp. N941]
MLRLVYPVAESEFGGHVTDGLPRIGFRTLIVAIALALVFAFGTHFLLKQMAKANAFSSEAFEQLRTTTKEDASFDLASAILESPLYVDIPPLQIGAAGTPKYDEVASPATKRVDAASFLPAMIASYFATDVSVVQVYLYFVSHCNEREDLKQCQTKLLNESYALVSDMKHNPFYILYRLEGGYIQLIASYIFALGVMVFILREFRAHQINAYMLDRKAAEKFAADEFATPEFDADDLPSLSLRATLRAWWIPKIENMDSGSQVTVQQQLREFGMVNYEPNWPLTESAELMRGRANLLHKYHIYLAAALRAKSRMTAAERFRIVLPRTILKVTTAFVSDQKHFPEVGRRLASEALEHSVDELAARIAADRDLYSRFVELTPVVGFFGTVWGLSLAMLGANDVIRAQGAGWNYNILNGTTYITEALTNVEEKQQFALQGMLSALSIKFDTTGYALILMFLLILFGAHSTRREYRAVSLLHSNITQKILSVLPTFGSIPTEVPKMKVECEPLETVKGWGAE